MSLRSGAGLTIAFVCIFVWVPVANAQAIGAAADVGIGETNNNGHTALGRSDTFTYGVDAGIGESDNVTLVSNDKVSQTIALTDADFDYKQQSRLLDVDAKGNFTYLDYLQNAYGGQLIGRFDGTADAAILPERITWALQESFGQQQIDPFAAQTPTNLQNVNYVSTGPNFALRLGPTVFLDFTARYARTTYQTDPFDSNRLLGTAALGLPLSAGSTVSIDGSFTRVLFDNTLVNTDFNRTSLYAHYEAHGARTDVTANLGITRVDEGGDTMSGPDAKLKVLRKLSSASTVSFTVGRDITDASAGFAALQGGAAGGIVTAPAAQALTNYTVTYATADWQYVRNRTTFGLSGNWEKDAYDNEPLLDLTRYSAQFRVERKLSRVFTAQLLGSYYKTDYANTAYNESDWLVGGGLVFREGRALEVRLRLDHVDRTVTGTGGGYTENRIFLTVGYRPRVAEIL